MPSLFTNEDLKKIESLIFNAELSPSYDSIKNCLVWADERAEGLTPAGYENLCDLWIARSFIHRGLDFSAHELDPAYFRVVWEQAKSEQLKWPGFNRLELSMEDKAYYDRMRESSNEI